MLRDRHVGAPLLKAVAAVSAVLVSQATANAAWTVEEKTISDLEYAYLSGTVTPTEVVQQYLDRIAMYNGGHLTGINAIADINPNVYTEASYVEGLIAGGATLEQYPLLGVPIIVKNSYDVEGMVTTNGVSVLNGSGTPGSTTLIAPDDAFNVSRLKQAGAIILGKASMSTMAYSYSGIDNDQGVVLNPYNPARQPGGSSSGTGAGLAANFAMAGMGGETGGSIRVPANHNALVGLKPSNGLINAEGTWPLVTNRDVVGPMAKTVSDVAYMMNALVAPSDNNPFDGTAFYPDMPAGTQRPADYADYLDTNALQGKVVAVPNEYYLSGVNTEVRAAFDDALEVMREQGANVIFVDMPDYSLSEATGGGWTSETSAYYYNELIKSYNDPVIKDIFDFATALEEGAAADAGFDDFSSLSGAARSIRAHANRVAEMMASGTYEGFESSEAQAGLQAIVDIREEFYSGFMDNPNLEDDPETPFDESTISKIDAFSMPSYGGVVPSVSDAILDALGLMEPETFGEGGGSLLGRNEGNTLGAPAISVPMGYLPDGTPMGLQFMTDFLEDHLAIAFAYDYEQATKWRVAPDLGFLIPEPTMATSMMLIGGFAMTRRRRRA